MPKLKVGTILPTADEDAAIDAGIASDADTREWTVDDFRSAKQASAMFPPEVFAALVAKRPRGRPRADETKVFTAIRLDADLLEAFKSNGKGWQTRINEALQEQMTVTLCLDVKEQIYVRFHVPDQTTADTTDEAFTDILSSLRARRVNHIYPVIGSYLTVKGRIPFGSNRSFWVYRAARRIRPASPDEVDSDRRDIVKALAAKGVTCHWVV